MGVLTLAALAAALALGGCYAPQLRDCTVSCAGSDDCAGGQICGPDGMCAAPGVAGHCSTTAAPDAGGTGTRPRDAGAVDAAPPDAPATVRLTVQIQGKGSVILDGAQTCSSLDPQKGNCGYDVRPGVPITAQAMAIDPTMTFTMWAAPTCAGQGPRCTFTPTTATALGAKFDHIK